MQLYNNNTYPKKTSVYCYYCSHPFDGQPIPCPVKYHKGEFHVKDNYCSWNCLKSANMYSDNPYKYTISSLIQMFHNKVTNSNKLVHPAPPREALKIYGGNMSIEEFRKDSATVYNKKYPPLRNVNPCIEKNVNFTFVKQDQANKNFELFTKDKPTNEPLKVQTKKVQNTLEQSMGLSLS